MATRWRELEQVEPDAREQWGGKACGLALLLRAEACVPRGIALAVDAGHPATWDEDERLALEAALTSLLARGPIAVRSSARAEDGETKSFAGIYETTLGVADAAGALCALERCRESAESERAHAYAGADAAGVGVVFQEQVDATAAGVLFTRDPAGRDAGALIEAVRGVGEALVSGHTEPARWRAYLAGTGATEVVLESEGAGLPMSDAETARIAAEARTLEEALGAPLDLEWALDRDGTLWWLQARPITALREPPPPPRIERTLPGGADGPVTVWTNLNVRETLPEPLGPLTWSFWRDRMMPAMGRITIDFGDGPGADAFGVADLVDGRIYWNVNAVLGIPGFEGLVEKMVEVIDASSGDAFRELRERGVLFPRKPRVGRLTMLRAWLRGQRRGIAGMIRALRPERSLRELEAFAASMNERDRGSLAQRSDVSLMEEIDEISDFEFMDVRRLMASLTLAIASFQIARGAFAPWPEAQGMLAVGIRRNPTTQMSLDLEELTRAARPLASHFLEETDTRALLEGLAGDEEGRQWLERFERYLDRNGQRCPGEFDLATPRWSEDPTMLLELVRGQLREPPKEGVGERLERLAGERERAVAAAVATAPRWKRPLLRFAARFAERHLPLREAGKHHLLHVFARMRKLALELGSRLAARGELETAHDVQLLELVELDDAVRGHLGGRALARRIEAARERLRAHADRSPPFFVRSDGVPVLAAADDEDPEGALRGAGIATGTVRGRVRVLDTPDPSAIEPGEILVVHLADPGWTPLFPRAGGLVMEVGGLMCHAAVVARELGIPAVFGVRGAKRALSDGDLVEVDADAGLVTLL